MSEYVSMAEERQALRAENEQLKAQLVEAQRERAHAEALLEDWNLTTEASAPTKLLRLKLSQAEAQLAALRELVSEYLDVLDNAPGESSTSELRAAVAVPKTTQHNEDAK